MDILSEITLKTLTHAITGSIVFLIIYEGIRLFIIYVWYWARYHNKIFIHCGLDFTPSVYQEDLHFTKIKIALFKPHVFINCAWDYDKNTLNKWKNWIGEVSFSNFGSKHGIGYYQYCEDIPEIGLHELIIRNRKVIQVRVTDYGKANISDNKDNLPHFHLWVEGNELVKMGKIARTKLRSTHFRRRK